MAHHDVQADFKGIAADERYVLGAGEGERGHEHYVLGAGEGERGHERYVCMAAHLLTATQLPATYDVIHTYTHIYIYSI